MFICAGKLNKIFSKFYSEPTTMLRVGAHLSKGKNLSVPIQQIIEAGGNALQIFLSPPVNSNSGTQLKASEIETVSQMQENNNFYVIIHGKYILNFARIRDKSSEWQFECLKSDLREADKINSDVIIHQGKNVVRTANCTSTEKVLDDRKGSTGTKNISQLNKSESEAEEIFAENISNILKETTEVSNKIILENSCHQGNEMGYTIEQLARIFGLIDSEVRSRIGFCLDLCHVYVAGTCDIRDPDQVELLFKKFDELIGLEHLKVVHFNDSKICLGGCNDHHDDLMVGKIGNPECGGSSAGFKTVVKICQTRKIPMILETPRNGTGVELEDQIKLIRSWAKEDDQFEKEYIEGAKMWIEMAKNIPQKEKAIAKEQTKIKIPKPTPKFKK